MDVSLILQITANNIVKTTRRTIEKLFSLHKAGKISEVEFKAKLDKLKDLVIKNTENLKAIQRQAEERNKADATMTFIVEHFNYKGCFASANLLASKFDILHDQDIFKMIENIKNELKQFNFTPAFEFYKDHRLLFKTNTFDTKLKLHRFIYLCSQGNIKEALMYLMSDLKKHSLAVKRVLPFLVDPISAFKTVDESHEALVEEIHASMLEVFRLTKESRLSKIVEYGMMAFKSQECFKEKNEKCPSCCPNLKLREEVPFNRHEQSIILCRGSGKELDDQNQPHAYDNGHVYGDDFIKENRGFVVCPRTGKTYSKYPRVCYFV
ncbi:E3 ubiquitin-protein transferase MAEA [Nosema granulosis]|uniref:E3 ubiquitin-protein transferase MAEA n=1 Tax=Nosema granulosis TaxID=83296 RepID=A0A9P6GY46_9MICR|nr:E3 ubiquitin-protein transferase MAEA [Nosema granulosis]